MRRSFVPSERQQPTLVVGALVSVLLLAWGVGEFIRSV